MPAAPFLCERNFEVVYALKPKTIYNTHKDCVKKF